MYYLASIIRVKLALCALLSIDLSDNITATVSNHTLCNKAHSLHCFQCGTFPLYRVPVAKIYPRTADEKRGPLLMICFRGFFSISAIDV